jgi:chaperonin GroEL|tara:strand:+ start:10247 stop:11812 length:1566 start_codon:yes stop_codon:yes gene_type:complete
MQESISSGKDLRDVIKETVTILSKAVKSTLGPSGTNVGVLSEIMLPVIVNDGVTVAKKIKFSDPLASYIAHILKTVSQNTESLAGDGTTTATTLAEAIILNGLKNIEAGFSQIDIVKGIRKATLLVLKDIENHVTSLSDNKDILLQVASISANNDEELGKLISDAFLKVGADGLIEVKDSATDKNYVDTVDGMKYQAGYESHMFINTNTSSVLLEDCAILIYEGKLKTIEPIIDMLKETKNTDSTILIIADDYGPEALNDLASNKVQYQLKVCAVRSPGYGTVKEQNLEDLALVTGATVISKRFGLDIEDATNEMKGKASIVKVTSDSFTIITEDTDEAKVALKIIDLKHELKLEVVETIKSEISERIAKLSNGIAVLYVAGSSPIEIAEKKFRIEDAINATRAAMEEGVVPGGGVTLLKIAKSIERPEFKNRGEEIGFEILLLALQAPIETICANAGANGAVVMKEVLSGDFNYGYDAKLDEYKDMVAAGILDPTKVTKAALVNASSVSQMLLSMDHVLY